MLSRRVRKNGKNESWQHQCTMTRGNHPRCQSLLKVVIVTISHWTQGPKQATSDNFLARQSRTMLLHAEHHWSDAVNTSIWPYAMRNACHVHVLVKKDKTPGELFSGIIIAAEVRHHHTFGCPVYVMASAIQQGKLLPTWMTRAHVGVNLGVSPTHA
jgi:hypothetical protein